MAVYLSHTPLTSPLPSYLPKDATRKRSFIMSISVLAGVITVLPVLAVLSPLFLLGFFRLWGVFLQAGSKDRRYAIFAHVKEELKTAKEKRKRFQDADDDDWEKVEGTTSAPNGEVPKSGDFGGIVGFFHPFW